MMTPLLKFVKLQPNEKHSNVYRYCLSSMYRESCQKRNLEAQIKLNQISKFEYDYKISWTIDNTKVLERFYLLEKVIEIKEFINLDALHLKIEQISDLLVFHSNEDEYLERINFLLGKTYFKEYIEEELIRTVMHPKYYENYGILMTNKMIKLMI